MEKRWQFRDVDDGAVSRLAKELSCSAIVAKLLCLRGLEDPEVSQRFLQGSGQGADPFLMSGMEAAVERILLAMEGKEKIVIYGDYDVDGITATSLLYRFFQRIGAEASYYIPERQSEGYGLNMEAVEHLIAEGTDLIITVDCGISSQDIVEATKDRVDMIITDHHTVPEIIPPAIAVLNPHQLHCQYPDKELCGAGVAYKLCQALSQRLWGRDYGEDKDIVALGTVADLVPLVGENRQFVKEGLAVMNDKTGNIGIRALAQVVGIDDKVITAGHIGFNLGPRLNAAGRVSHATKGVDLLTSTNFSEAQLLAQELNELNGERQEIERHIKDEAREAVIALGDEVEYAIVVGHEGWHPGVIGIVASRLVEEFYRPSLVIAISEGVGKGSCRSIEGCHMYEALASMADLFLGFGGHRMAAGFTIEADKIPELRQRFNEYCKGQLSSEDYVPIVAIDEALEPGEVDVPLIEEVAQLEPYGMGNATPIFAFKNAEITAVTMMGALKNHCKMAVKTDSGTVEAISWNAPELFRSYFAGDEVKIAFTMQKNEWRGTVRPQLMIKDIELMAPRRYGLTVEDLRTVYKKLNQMMGGGREPSHHDVESFLLEQGTKAGQADRMLALTIFKELGIVSEVNREGAEPAYAWHSPSGKIDLKASPSFRRHCEGGCE